MDFNRYLYGLRYSVENRLYFNDWRSFATRSAKKMDSFVAALEICILQMWLKVY